jgi:hypothetical protein
MENQAVTIEVTHGRTQFNTILFCEKVKVLDIPYRQSNSTNILTNKGTFFLDYYANQRRDEIEVGKYYYFQCFKASYTYVVDFITD